jgi:hypothetical protein
VMTRAVSEAFERSIKRSLGFDPFAGIDLNSLTSLPEYLLGSKEAFAWPYLMGALVEAIEADLRWPRKSDQVDRRTLAVLIGLAFVETRSEHPMASDWKGGDDIDEEGIKAGAALMIAERAVVEGYVVSRE